MLSCFIVRFNPQSVRLTSHQSVTSWYLLYHDSGYIGIFYSFPFFFQKPVPPLLTVSQIIVVFTFFYVGNIPRKKVTQRLFGTNSLCVRRWEECIILMIVNVMCEAIAPIGTCALYYGVRCITVRTPWVPLNKFHAKGSRFPRWPHCFSRLKQNQARLLSRWKRCRNETCSSLQQ